MSQCHRHHGLATEDHCMRGGSCKRITRTRCLCLVLALFQTGSGQTNLTELVSSKKKKKEFMFMKILYIFLLETMVFPGADRHSNENHIITTAKACSTAYVISWRVKKKSPHNSKTVVHQQVRQFFCMTFHYNLYVNYLKCHLNYSSKVAIKPREL